MRGQVNPITGEESKGIEETRKRGKRLSKKRRRKTMKGKVKRGKRKPRD